MNDEWKQKCQKLIRCGKKLKYINRIFSPDSHPIPKLIIGGQKTC